MITIAPLYQSFSSKLIVKDGFYPHSCKRFEELSVRLPSVDLRGINEGCVGKSTSSRLSRLYGFHSSKHHSTRLHPVFSTSSAEHHSYSSQISENESILILMRHGESMWDEKNLFTGCVDVPLTNRGVEEAIEAGKRISNFPLDIIYTYGELNKQETAELYGKEQVYNWRRSYHVRTPNGESLEMCLGRAVAFFKDHIEPHLTIGRHVMVVAHANSLRSIIMYLDKLTSDEVINLELSTSVPMLSSTYIKKATSLGEEVPMDLLKPESMLIPRAWLCTGKNESKRPMIRESMFSLIDLIFAS